MSIPSYDMVKNWLTLRVHTIIYPKHSDDFNTMNEIMSQHVNYSEWKNTEPEYFQITRSSKKKALQVFVKFKGLKRPRIVSWVDCTDKNHKNSSKTDKLSQAMRYSIAPQTQRYRDFTMGERKCVKCESRAIFELEVDHFPKKFVEIKNEFLKSHPESLVTEFGWNPVNGRYYFLAKDSHFEKAFQVYHQNEASYRFLCRRCNQKNE